MHGSVVARHQGEPGESFSMATRSRSKVICGSVGTRCAQPFLGALDIKMRQAPTCCARDQIREKTMVRPKGEGGEGNRSQGRRMGLHGAPARHAQAHVPSDGPRPS